MKLKSYLFVALVFFSVLSFSQDDETKLFLKHTSVVIHKAQKQMMAAGKTEAGGLLAKSVVLQSHAVKMYARDKKDADVLCSSARAREIANEIILKMGGKENAYYSVSPEEKKLLPPSSCLPEEQLIKKGKAITKNISENDNDYSDPKSLNGSNIDIH